MIWSIFLCLFLTIHILFILIKLYDLLIINAYYSIKYGKDISDRFERLLQEKGLKKAIHFLNFHYKPLKLYKKIIEDIPIKWLQRLVTLYYKWPILLFISSIALYVLTFFEIESIFNFPLIASIILIIVSELIHEVSARLMLGRIDNMRQYIFIFDIHNNSKLKDIRWHETKILRDFFLTISIQLITFCIGYAAIYYSISKIEIGAFKDIPSLSIIDSIYFSVTTLTTTGYGDIIPDGWLCKIIVITQMVVVYLFIIVIVSHFSQSNNGDLFLKDKD